MKHSRFEIRACVNCGLRYPIIEGHAFGTRCPQCLGETQVVLKKSVLEENAAGRETKGKRAVPLAALLDNIRSAWNVGSILRSANGFGFDHAYLCGITPTPENEAVRKTSLGAENFIAWSHHKDAVKLVENLKAEGWKVSALEESEGAGDIRAAVRGMASAKTQNTKRVLVVGNEVTGVDPGLLDVCDEIFFIPMRGGKRSFNAAIAFSIAAFALTNSP
jgi:23S rRNA (guanosine2251-2'-O)-methyltransferase